MNIVIRATQYGIRETEATDFPIVSVSLPGRCSVQLIIEVRVGDMDFVRTNANDRTCSVSARRALEVLGRQRKCGPYISWRRFNSQGKRPRLTMSNQNCHNDVTAAYFGPGQSLSEYCRVNMQAVITDLALVQVDEIINSIQPYRLSQQFQGQRIPAEWTIDCQIQTPS
jgi:hypothetical protein